MTYSAESLSPACKFETATALRTAVVTLLTRIAHARSVRRTARLLSALDDAVL